MIDDVEGVVRAGDESDRRHVLGSTVMLAAALTVGIAVGWLLLGFHGTFYVPILMPCLIGWAVGSTVAWIRGQFGIVPARGPYVAAVMAALISYGAYHLFVYDRILTFLAGELPGIAEQAAIDATRQVQLWFEERTGQRGFLAYLTFVSTGRGAEISPLGLLGAAEPGLLGTLAAIAVETVVAATASVAFVQLRSPRVPEGPLALPVIPSGRGAREVVAYTNAATLAEVTRAMNHNDYLRAGQLLAQTGDEGEFAVTLVEDPLTSEVCLIEVCDVTAHGLGEVRASRRIDGWHALMLTEAQPLSDKPESSGAISPSSDSPPRDSG